MSNYGKDIIVSCHFVEYAMQAAGKLVYENRSKRYQNASPTVQNGIELRNDRLDDFIECYIESYWDSIEWDAYDIIDDWYAWDEKSYKEIREQVRINEFQESEEEDVCKEFIWTQTQVEEVEEWCRDNWYWYDCSYEVAVQDVYTYNS